MDEDEDERYEGDDVENDEDTRIINWADQGYLGYVDPNSQFEWDDDLEFEYHTDPWPWDKMMGNWRHRLIATWRLISPWK